MEENVLYFLCYARLCCVDYIWDNCVVSCLSDVLCDVHVWFCWFLVRKTVAGGCDGGGGGFFLFVCLSNQLFARLGPEYATA